MYPNWHGNVTENVSDVVNMGTFLMLVLWSDPRTRKEKVIPQTGFLAKT